MTPMYSNIVSYILYITIIHTLTFDVFQIAVLWPYDITKYQCETKYNY